MELLRIKVADFEGPFDLLLHLIKKNKMNIYNVEIAKITNQYLEYLEEMKEMDLEVTSEFVLIAATLIEIKSKNLLPKIKIESDEDEEDIEKRLMSKLIEYKQIKAASEFFRERFISSGEVYSKKPEIIEEERQKQSYEDVLKNITLLDLYNIYNKVIDSYKEKQNVENVIQKKIYADRFKVEDKMNELLEQFKREDTIEFAKLISNSECKLETVVTFLALLELIKVRLIKVYQDDSFGKILMKKRIKDE